MTKGVKRQLREAYAKSVASSKRVSTEYANRALAVTGVTGHKRPFKNKLRIANEAKVAQYANDIMTWKTFRPVFRQTPGLYFCHADDYHGSGDEFTEEQVSGPEGGSRRHCVYVFHTSDTKEIVMFDANIDADRQFAYRHLASYIVDELVWRPKREAWYQQVTFAYPENQASFYEQSGTQFGVCAVYVYACQRIMTAEADPREFTSGEVRRMGSPCSSVRVTWLTEVLDAPKCHWLNFVEAVLGPHTMWDAVYVQSAAVTELPPVDLRRLYNILEADDPGAYDESTGEGVADRIGLMV